MMNDPTKVPPGLTKIFSIEFKDKIQFSNDDGKLIGAWDALKWSELTAVTEQLAAVMTDVCELPAACLIQRAYQKPTNNHATWGIELCAVCGDVILTQAADFD